MASLLQIAIQNSKVLTDKMRQKLLASEPQLSEAQIQQILAVLKEEEGNYEKIMQEDAAKKTALANDYNLKIRDFNAHTIPAAMRSIESKDKADEEESLSGLLSELDKT
ncbi:MAG: hypothetical protein WC882_03435 [Candidatus Gracilibacteria bacterium]|jgi:hypothetical protein